MWVYNNTEFKITSTEYIGFVYLIENLIDKRKYIGKKLLYKKIKRKKKRVVVESDWREYWSSCKELQEDVEKLGKHNFRRTILMLCKSKGELNYCELREQVLRDAIITSDYYNSYVGSRIHRKHVKNVTPLQSS